MPPLVSVAMPVYNAEPYLEEAVQSILNQTFRDFEFIIIDDGSTDGSLAILRKLASTDSRIRVISRANTGHSRAINEMIDLSRGEFIARMDGDDISMPDRFQRQIDFLREHPEVVAVGGDVIWIDKDGDEIRPFAIAHTHEEIDGAHINGVGGAISHPAAMFRKSALVAVGGIREETHLAEDFDLFLRLAEYGKLMNLNGTVLKWRLHAASTGATKAMRQREIKHKVLREARQRRGLPIMEQESPPAEDAQAASHADTQRMWAWWALKAKNVAVARKLAWSALCQSPLNRASWVAMFCAVRGH